MSRLALLAFAASLLVASPFAARADEGFYPIKADDGEVIANHRVSAGTESQIEKLPGVVVAGNPRGKVTINEFYDVNCPYCRKASGDINALLDKKRELRLVLVPFPVLGVPSILGTRVELAVARIAPPQEFYKFHRRLDQTRGAIDANVALAAAKALGLDTGKVLQIANEDSLADVMKAHLKLANALGIQATPGFVIKGVAINGYPGPKSLAELIESVQHCDAVICPSN